MSQTISSPPSTSAITQGQGIITQIWLDWFVLVVLKAIQAGVRLLSHPVESGGSTTATSQNASIAATAFPLTSITAGLYRVAWTARVTTPAGINSSLSVSVNYTRLGTGCTQTSTSLTSNATNLPGSGSFLVHNDGGSPISYFTTYASAGVPAMIYEIDATCESVA